MSIETDLTTDDPTPTTEEPAVIGELSTVPGEAVEVRRRAGLAVVLGAGASLTAVAYFARAVAGGGALDWVLAAVTGVIGMIELVALVDARTPLLVADDLGVRLRLGRTWVGLPWAGLQVLEHQPRRGWRDGRLVARPAFVGRVLEDLDGPSRRVARANCRLHGAPLAVPLGVATRVVGAGPDLTETLRALADGRATVVAPVAETPAESTAQPTHQPVSQPVSQLLPDVVPGVVSEVVPLDPEATEATEAGVARETPGDVPVEVATDDDQGIEVIEAAGPARRVPDPRPAIARLISGVAARLDRTPGETEDEAGVLAADEAETPAFVASQTPEPTRDPVSAARAEVRRERRARLEQSDDAGVADPWDALEEETQVWADLHAEEEDRAEPHLMIDDHVVEPPADPVIGPELAAARERLGLTVDQLAERTRIRPHVIEALELDDFSACGGDFYARGHLRTLARVLGLDVAPLLAAYDERYADAPIDARRVFEAELAGAGSIRATLGGPNWSVLVAAVMALILCWSVARLVTGGVVYPEDRAILSGSGGPDHLTMTAAKPVPVTVRATAGGARVVVRDGNDHQVFAGDLAYGQSRTLQAAPPVRIRSTDGSVRVTVAGQDRGRMGPTGRPATRSYVPR